MAMEIGRKYRVDLDGETVPIDDDVTEAGPGDILQIVYETEKDLVRQNIRDVIVDTLKMKEEYGFFVLHHIKIDKRRITVQFSVAPAGAEISAAAGDITASPQISGVVIPLFVKIIVLAASLAGIFAWLLNMTVDTINQKILRRPPATGHAEVVAKDQETDLPLANVNITMAGQTKKTGRNGEAAFFKDIIIGKYTVIGANVTGYQPPEAGSVTVVEAAVASCTIWYKPDGYVEPTHGWLSLATAGAEGDIYVEGQIVGKPGYAHLYIEKGDYDVYFGPVEGYITPPMATLKVVGGKTTSYIAYYELPVGEWWKKYVYYALIGGGVIIGAAILIPQVIQIATKPRIGPPKGGGK